MQSEELLHAAARNNATWCSLVCAAHGSAGSFTDAAWINPAPAPRLYPNLVTLAPGPQAGQLAAIAKLAASTLPAGWAVKDSYAALDLASLGFTRLFQASWLGLPAAVTVAGGPPGIAWGRIDSAGELAAWERAWAAPARPEGLFRPPLLADPRITVFAGYRGGEIVAGAIACRSDGVIGLSNVFGPPGELAAALPGCIGLARDFAPNLALVGWECGPEAAVFATAGFRPLGPLAVWKKP